MTNSFSSRCEQIVAILRKDFLLGLRRRASFAAMMMFALTAVAALSLSTGGAPIEPKILAAMLWVVIFFAAGAGLAGTFDDEAQAGTLPTLKLYADAQAILSVRIVERTDNFHRADIFGAVRCRGRGRIFARGNVDFRRDGLIGGGHVDGGFDDICYG